MKTEATHIPATDPQCQALQGGYDAYAAGLILAASHTINRDASIASVGSWLVECQGRLANVHPVLGAWDSIQTHEGQRVYGVRFWL